MKTEVTKKIKWPFGCSCVTRGGKRTGQEKISQNLRKSYTNNIRTAYTWCQPSTWFYSLRDKISLLTSKVNSAYLGEPATWPSSNTKQYAQTDP